MSSKNHPTNLDDAASTDDRARTVATTAAVMTVLADVPREVRDRQAG